MKTKEEKKCTKCKENKSFNCFYKDKQKVDGLTSSCSDCIKGYFKNVGFLRAKVNRQKWVERNREKTRGMSKTYYKEHREEVLPKRRAYDHKQETLLLKAISRKKRYQQDPTKFNAVSALGNAVRSGRVVKNPCIKCGDEKVQGHHFDYNKPLDVIWLCMKHHRIEHGRWLGEE